MKKPTDPLVQEFLDDLKTSNYSPQTVINYRTVLNRIVKELGTEWWLQSHDELKTYLKSRVENGASIYEISGKLTLFKIFCDWLREKGKLIYSPAANIKLSSIWRISSGK